MSQALSALYLSWPFTPNTKTNLIEEYHDLLLKEIKRYSARHASNVPLESIYWGGGDLSTYPEPLLLDTSDTLRSMFAFDAATEVTLETSPKGMCKEQLKLWGRLGVNRLVFGIKNLEDLGHVPFDVLQSTGLNNVAVDLTLGQPGVLKNEWETLIHAVATRPVTHISVYFCEQVERDEDVASAYCWTVQELERYGFEQYEMYSFAKQGFRSKQQQVYFDRKRYKGFGVGACSFDGMQREEVVTPEQERREKIMFGLRQAHGIERSYVNADDVLLDDLKKQGLIKQHGERIALTSRGYLVSNEIIVKLF